jgi:hypothetical protein
MKRILSLILAAAMTLSVAACGPDVPQKATVNQKNEQFTELMARPDIDEAVSQYEEMYAKVRNEITALVPALTWKMTNPVTSASCGNDFEAVNDGLPKDDAEIKGLAIWMADGKIPDAQWEVVLSAVDKILRLYGFNSGPDVVKNNPSDHYVTFQDPTNAEVTFGSAVNTGLTVRTGCHLTAEAKKRGTPAPTPTY